MIGSTPASRADIIGALGVMLVIMGAAVSFGRNWGGVERATEQGSTLLAQRNRENDALERRIESLESVLRHCTP